MTILDTLLLAILIDLFFSRQNYNFAKEFC